MDVPPANCPEHTPPQSMPEGLEVTLPKPFPAGVIVSCGPNRPNTVNCAPEPTYTLPLATVGTVNFRAPPGSSRPPVMSLEYSRLRLLASWALKTEEPVKA